MYKLSQHDRRELWSYIMPSIIGMTVAGSFSIVDTIFIGRATGETGLAAVAVTWPLLMLVMAVGSLCGGGGAVLLSQARGANEEPAAQSAFRMTWGLSLFFSLVLTLLLLPFLPPMLQAMGADEQLMPQSLAYARIMLGGLVLSVLLGMFIEMIRNDGSPKLAMWMVVLGLLINAALDWYFIMQLGWGVSGAAWASILGEAVSAAVGVYYFCSRHTTLRFPLCLRQEDWNRTGDILRTGTPIFGSSIAIIAMLYLHNFQSLRYGQVDGLAAYTMVAAVESLGSLLLTGLAGGMQPLTARMHGAKEYDRQNSIGNYSYALAFGLGVVLMLFSFATCTVMPSWMGLSGHAAQLAGRGLVLSAPAFILLGVIRVAAYYYQSTGKTLDSSLLIYGDSFVVLPLCLFTLPQLWGMDGVWLSMPLSRLLLFGLLLYLWYGKKKPGKAGLTK